jgi:DNA-binding transcriptional LysR family regulator
VERGGPERFAAAVTPASLRATLAVSATGSESAAATVLGISQPAVHRSLAALEYLVGCSVFHKSARGTRLTEAGQALVWRVKLAMAEARALQSDIDGWRGQVRGRVVIGALPLSVALVLPQAVHQVRLRHPEVEITVVDGAYDSLVRQLLEADIDLMVGALRAPTPELRQEPLVDEALAIVARPGHPCLQRSPLRLADLLAWEWVVPLPGTPASTALHRVFAQAGLNPPPGTVEAGSAAFTRALVSSSDRLAMTSMGQALDDAKSGALVRVPIALPSTSRLVGLTVRAAGDPSPDLQVVLDALREAAQRTPLGARL